MPPITRSPERMKFVEPGNFTDPAAARKLVEIAGAAEAVHDDRIRIDRVNAVQKARRREISIIF
jgi:hypothetical protein